MGDKQAQAIIEREASLRAGRSTYEAHWQQIARLMLPGRADFTGAKSPGSQRMEEVFDGTALTALDNLAGGLWGTVTNSANKWFEIGHADRNLARRQDVKLWCSSASDAMLKALAGNGQRFYAQAIASFRDLAAFGTNCFYVEHPDFSKRTLTFEAKPLHRVVVAENDAKRVDTVFEKFHYTARQAVQRFKDKTPKEIAKAAEKNPDQKFTFVFACMPAADWLDLGGDELPRRDMTTASPYVCVETGGTVEAGGNWAFPYQVARWSPASEGPYGDSPAMLALPDTKMVNQMSKTTLVGAQKAVDPTILAPDEAGMRGARLAPGQILYGGVDMQGRALYQPLLTGGNAGLGLELEEQRRKAIREAFYATLLLMAENPGMTATEWLGRQEEKLRLWGPHIGLVQSEWLDPLLDTMFVYMARASAPFWARGVDGWLPRPPEAMAESPELKIEFVSPLARAQKASGAAALDRFVASIMPVAQIKPELMDNIDGDAYVRVMSEGHGVPAEVMRDPELVAQDRTVKAQQAHQLQLAQMAAPAKQGADALKSLAQAGQIAGGDAGGMGAAA